MEAVTQMASRLRNQLKIEIETKCDYYSFTTDIYGPLVHYMRIFHSHSIIARRILLQKLGRYKSSLDHNQVKNMF